MTVGLLPGPCFCSRPVTFSAPAGHRAWVRGPMKVPPHSHYEAQRDTCAEQVLAYSWDGDLRWLCCTGRARGQARMLGPWSGGCSGLRASWKRGQQAVRLGCGQDPRLSSPRCTHAPATRLSSLPQAWEGSWWLCLQPQTPASSPACAQWFPKEPRDLVPCPNPST